MSVVVLVPALDSGYADAARRWLGRRRASRGADALARLLSPHLRTSDTITYEGSHALVVAPETGAAGASTVVDRLVSVAAREGVPLRTGTATFPDDGQRPEDLVASAARRSTATVARSRVA